MGHGNSNADSDDHEAEQHDSWESDGPSTAANPARLVVGIAGACGLMACMLLLWHFAFAQPVPVAPATATFVTQPPVQPATPTFVPTPPAAGPVVSPATPIAQPAPPKPVAKDGRVPIEYQPLRADVWKAKNQSTWLFPWEGERVVLLTTTADFDPMTMAAFVKRLDAGWKLCSDLVGRSPALARQHHGKVTIAAVPDASFTYGPSYAMSGSTGIEVAEFYGPQGDYERFRTAPDQFSDRYFFAMAFNHHRFSEQSGMFVTSYLMAMSQICMEGIAPTAADTQTRQLIERHEEDFAKSNATFAQAFPYFGAKTQFKLNDIDGKPQYADLNVLLASAFLKFRKENGGDEWAKRFFQHLSECPPIVVRQPNEMASVANGQLLNWVIAASLATGKDLSPLFRDRWRFPFASEVWQALIALDWKKPGLTADNVFDALPSEHLLPSIVQLRPSFLTPERRKQNLLVGGTFEGDAASKWKLDSFRANLQSGAMEGGVVKEGQKAAVLRTTINDDTRFTQTVTIKPGTRYLLSGWIKTKDVEIDKDDRKYGKAGATLSIWGGYEHSRSLVSTNDWTYSTLIFDSGNRTEVGVLARLGYWYSTASGEAWFDDLCLIPIGGSPVRPVAQSPPPAPGPDEKDNLLANGSFEEGPEIPANMGWLSNVRVGSTAIKGWTVTRGNIDFISNRHWIAGHGQRSIDLHGGPGFGGVKQSFKTVVGQRYQVSFLMSGTPQQRIPLFKLAVRAADKQQEFSFDATGKSQNQMGWTRKTWDFVAIATETTLEIHTLQTTVPEFGPVIDDVSVIAVAAVKTALANPLQAEAPPVAISGRELRRFEGHRVPVWKAVFSADGKRVLSGSGFPKGDSTMRLWDVETGGEVRQFRNDGTNWGFGVALSHDGKQALSGNAVGISLWDAETGAVLRRMEIDSSNKTVLTVAFAPDGKRAVSGGSDRVVRLWDLVSGTQIRALNGHLGRVMSVAFSPDGSQIVSCGLDEDKTVRLWSTETGKEILRLEGHTAGVESVAFTPDGNRIVSSAFDGLILWDAKSGKLIRKIVGDGTDLLEAVFFPDGRRVLSGNKSGRVSIWDSETGQELQRLAQGSEWVWTVAVSPDGLRGVSAGGSSNINGKWEEGKDFAIRLWPLPASINSAKTSDVTPRP